MTSVAPNFGGYVLL